MERKREQSIAGRWLNYEEFQTRLEELEEFIFESRKVGYEVFDGGYYDGQEDLMRVILKNMKKLAFSGILLGSRDEGKE